MKHLIKFNENKDPWMALDMDDVVNYIKLVFSEFSDDPKYNLEYDGPDKLITQGYYFDILIHIPKIHNWVSKKNNLDNIKSLINNSNELVEFYSDIEVCMKRVKDEYPNIEFKIAMEKQDIPDEDHYSDIDILAVCFTIK